MRISRSFAVKIIFPPGEFSVSSWCCIDKTDSGDCRDGIVLLLYELDHVRNASVSGNLEY